MMVSQLKKGQIFSVSVSQCLKGSEILSSKKHANSKCYKAVTKDLEIPVSTVCTIMKKFHSHKTVKMLLGWGAKKKLNRRSLQRLVGHVKNQKELQADLEQSDLGVSGCTLSHTLNQVGFHRQRPRRIPP